LRLLVTGGAGFIGSNFVRRRAEAGDSVTVLDKLTYAGHVESLEGVLDSITFVEGDICDAETVGPLVAADTDAVVNFAAETHVDRSIMGSAEFVRTNVEGVRVLLDEAARAGTRLFCQVSTDEVYGSAGPDESFTEASRLRPTSPYAASKAAADLLALSYYRTHGVPVVITRCTNNYGPRQHPEKLIPLFILRATADEELPLYGDGLNERDWLHVEDHCRALDLVIEKGGPGEVYNVSAGGPVTNREVVKAIIEALGKPESLVRLVKDRPAHDRRYAIDSTRLRRELGWRPEVPLARGLARTIEWYRSHPGWLRAVTGPEFEEHCRRLYAGRPDASAPAEAEGAA
jgi:dTDP-glucose 4,6-dehydratase